MLDCQLILKDLEVFSQTEAEAGDEDVTMCDHFVAHSSAAKTLEAALQIQNYCDQGGSRRYLMQSSSQRNATWRRLWGLKEMTKGIRVTPRWLKKTGEMTLEQWCVWRIWRQ